MKLKLTPEELLKLPLKQLQSLRGAVTRGVVLLQGGGGHASGWAKHKAKAERGRRAKRLAAKKSRKGNR